MRIDNDRSFFPCCNRVTFEQSPQSGLRLAKTRGIDIQPHDAIAWDVFNDEGILKVLVIRDDDHLMLLAKIKNFIIGHALHAELPCRRYLGGFPNLILQLGRNQVGNILIEQDFDHAGTFMLTCVSSTNSMA